MQSQMKSSFWPDCWWGWELRSITLTGVTPQEQISREEDTSVSLAAQTPINREIGVWHSKAHLDRGISSIFQQERICFTMDFQFNVLVVHLSRNVQCVTENSERHEENKCYKQRFRFIPSFFIPNIITDALKQKLKRRGLMLAK